MADKIDQISELDDGDDEFIPIAPVIRTGIRRRRTSNVPKDGSSSKTYEEKEIPNDASPSQRRKHTKKEDRPSDDEMFRVFNSFDKNGDGKIAVGGQR